MWDCFYVIITYITEKNTLEMIVNNASKMSPNVYEYHLKRGYITTEFGHRISFCGNAVVRDNSVITINDLNTVVIRVSKNEMLYCKNIFLDLFNEKSPCNICVISPPGCGKTTFLRNFIYYLSHEKNWLNICVADERCEIFNNDDMCNNVSKCFGMPKVSATELFIKNMSPHIIVYDELYSEEELGCIIKANASGVYSVFSVHGENYDKLIASGIDLKNLCNDNLKIVEISNKKGCGTIESIRRV